MKLKGTVLQSFRKSSHDHAFDKCSRKSIKLYPNAVNKNTNGQVPANFYLRDDVESFLCGYTFIDKEVHGPSEGYAMAALAMLSGTPLARDCSIRPPTLAEFSRPFAPESLQDRTVFPR